MLKTTRTLAFAGLVTLVTAGNALAERIQPFILGSSGPGDVAGTVASTKDKLSGAGFDIAGTYTPYDGATIIIFTSDELKAAARNSERGGYGAALRAAVTQNGGNVEVAYTNPVYWANAYRMKDNLDAIAAKLESTLGAQQQFSSGDKELTAEDMRKYHYTFMMEYFDDPSNLGVFDDHADAVKTLENNIAQGKGATKMIYKINVGKDPEGNEMTLIGVGLKGSSAEDCSGDEYVMSRIDKDTPRSTAHLPYEILVYGDEAEALYARFRIAISWPHLPMMASETGATFMSIMCSPEAIKEALTKAAGGKSEDF
ncbi:MAG: hypothetical protein KJP10_01105 [Gammaproteobacteria bacterium]|nr:hypothetical protein [Gammaproteobacteria bacterium]